MSETVALTLNTAQASAVSEALDIYMRLCLGQLHVVGEMIRDERIPMHNASCVDRQPAPLDVLEGIDFSINQVKRSLGYGGGCSLNVGHPHLHKTGIRSYEVMKVLDKVLAEHREPNPSFRGVSYDGLTVRYTSDPAPEAKLLSHSGRTESVKAFELADRCTREMLESESLSCDEVGNVLAVLGEDGNPLHSIAAAPAHIQEAVEWLVNRRLAAVVAGPEGDEVVVLVDKGDF
jgi:hypothetical protein